MSTYPRSEIITGENTLFHAFWKCHNDEWLLRSEYSKRLYYNLLLKYKTRYQIQIFSWCLMSNHPHLTGRCPSQKNLSDFFRCVNSQFAAKMNKFLKRKGQVVNDRFKSPVIETDEKLLSVIIYNDLNPTRTIKGIHPDHYKWSSYHHYASGKEDPLITQPECYLELASTPEERQREYKKMINEIILSDEKIKFKCPYKNRTRLLVYIGDPIWVKKNYDRIRKSADLKRKLWKKQLYEKDLSRQAA